MLNLKDLLNEPQFATDSLDGPLAYWLAPGTGADVDGLPKPSRCAFLRDSEIVWASPNQWLVFGPAAEDPPAAVDFSIQSDGRIIFNLPVAEARVLLPFGCAVDFSDDKFPAGQAAATQIHHFSALIWRPANLSDQMRVAVFRSYAESFDEWLQTHRDLQAQIGTSCD